MWLLNKLDSHRKMMQCWHDWSHEVGRAFSDDSLKGFASDVSRRVVVEFVKKIGLGKQKPHLL